MKKLMIVLFSLVMAVLIFSPIAHADQGVYGTVYAWADGVNDCYVQGAVVIAYDNQGREAGRTTASICGYYTLALDPGINYQLVVEGAYNEREKGNCTNVVDDEYVAGDVTVSISSGFWYAVNINCL